jgi:hypothetical protein
MTATYVDTQLDLSPLTEPVYAVEATLAERFAEFHRCNPHVADALESLAAQWLARHERAGMKSLAERIRWESGLRTTGEPWRLNNSHVAFYSRLLLARHPEWTGRIQTRRAHADNDTNHQEIHHAL